MMPQTVVSRKSKLFLWASLLISLIFAAGHTYGTLNIVNGDVKDVLAAQTVTIEGIEKTFSSIFLGNGYIITVFLVLQGLVLWIISSSNSPENRRLVGLFTLASAVNACIAAIYLIFIPALFLAAVTMCLTGAWITFDTRKASA